MSHQIQLIAGPGDQFSSLTTAVFRLDRTNTRATDPNDPTRSLQTGGHAWKNVWITSATRAARAGALVEQTPHHTFSLWNHYQLLPRMGAGVSPWHRADMFAAVDNTVTLPAYTRADAAVYYSVTERSRLQLNCENLLNHRYFLNADSNNNISPGAGRTLRAALIFQF